MEEEIQSQQVCITLLNVYPDVTTQGRIKGGRTRRATPLKWEKIRFFGVKSWFFTRNTQKNFAPPSAWRNFFKCAPSNLKPWIRPCHRPLKYTPISDNWLCSTNKLLYSHFFKFSLQRICIQIKSGSAKLNWNTLYIVLFTPTSYYWLTSRSWILETGASRMRTVCPTEQQFR